MGIATIPSITGVSHRIVLAVLVIMAGLMFFLMEKFEKKAT
jgi:hypothetical protein